MDILALKESSQVLHLNTKTRQGTSTATPSIKRKHRTTYAHKRSASRGLEQVLEREVLRRERPADPEARVDEASPRFGQRVGISRHTQQLERGRRRGRRSAEPFYHVAERCRVAVARRRARPADGDMDVCRERPGPIGLRIQRVLPVKIDTVRSKRS